VLPQNKIFVPYRQYKCFLHKHSQIVLFNNILCTLIRTEWPFSTTNISFKATGRSIQHLEIHSRPLRLNSTRITVIIIDHVLNTIQRSDSEESVVILCTKCIELTHKAWLVQCFFDNLFRITAKFILRSAQTKANLNLSTQG